METRGVKTKAKVITLEQEFLSLLEFYEDGEYSKVKFKSGYQNDNIIFEDNQVRFCPKNIAINNYNIAKIPARYSKCKNITLDNGGWEIIGTDKSIQDALNYSVKYTKNYPNNLPPFFVGTTGAGKTHLSVSIITELIFKHGKKCLFKQFRDLLSDIKDIYVKNESEKQYVDKLCKFDVLVIDDLGATRMSEWETSVLDTLIANRYNSKKHTIFSSNLAFLDSNLYKVTSKDQVLDYKIGERNISRIFEMCSVLEMKGMDYRKKNRTKK